MRLSIHLMCDNLQPDLTFLLDLEASLGLSRAWKDIGAKLREDCQHRFEEEALNFHEQVRRGYLERAEKEPDRFQVIDATPDMETVRVAIVEEMQRVW